MRGSSKAKPSAVSHKPVIRNFLLFGCHFSLAKESRVALHLTLPTCLCIHVDVRSTESRKTVQRSMAKKKVTRRIKLTPIGWSAVTVEQGRENIPRVDSCRMALGTGGPEGVLRDIACGWPGLSLRGTNVADGTSIGHMRDRGNDPPGTQQRPPAQSDSRIPPAVRRKSEEA